MFFRHMTEPPSDPEDLPDSWSFFEEGEELTHVQEVLGPPLDFLPKDIELQDLNAYRDLNAVRLGNTERLGDILW